MTAHVPRLPFSLDPLVAEAKRRAKNRRVLIALLVVVAAGAAVGITLTRPWSGGGIHVVRRYVFAVKAVNSSRIVNDVSYVSLGSPVVLARKKLARTALFDISGGFYLTKTSPRGPVLCSFAKPITDSKAFPNANGKTVSVEVYGRETSPRLAARICTAFESFSLSY